MAKQEYTYEGIIRELQAKQYRTVYYLMGDEAFYIDKIADYIIDNVLTDTEKEFNQTILYGADVDAATIINAAKRYPMMSEYQEKSLKYPRNTEEVGGAQRTHAGTKHGFGTDSRVLQ